MGRHEESRKLTKREKQAIVWAAAVAIILFIALVVSQLH